MQRPTYTLEEIAQLRDYCQSERQTEILEAVLAEGSIRKAARLLSVHPNNIRRAVSRVFRTAAWQGRTDQGPQENIPPTHYLKGTSTYYNANGEVTGRWIKTNAKQADLFQGLREFAEGLGEGVRRKWRPRRSPKQTETDLLTVYPLADLHLGMLAWSRETREDYDVAIASEALDVAANFLVAKTPRSHQCVIANLGDFFHFDNDQKRTSSGNSLDVDSRWTNVVGLGVECLLRFIWLALEKHQTVRIVNSVGNHDGQSAIMLPFILKPYFENEPRVTVEDAPRAHHYHVFGSNLLGFHHGDKTKPAALPQVATADMLLNPNVDTSQVEFVHWLTGHVHHESKEFGGQLVESFRTLAAKDAWHAGQGYRALRDIQAVTYHRQFGECDRSRVSWKMIKHASVCL